MPSVILAIAMVLPMVMSGPVFGEPVADEPVSGQPVAAGASGPAVIDLKVTEFSKDRGIVGFDQGRQSGIAPGDAFWLLADSKVIATGEIILATDQRSAGRLAGEKANVETGGAAVVLSCRALPELRDLMPPDATVRGKIARLPPGRRTAWLDIDASGGLRLGDQILVTRKGIPISRGHIQILDADSALATLQPLVSNALPQIGDTVELWPAPSDARWGRLNTTVLRVTEGPEGTLNRVAITIAGSAEDGLAIDRLADVYRGRQYVGTAQISEVYNPISAARMLDVATATRPADGDRVVVRASPDGPPGPLIVPVTKVDQDYCHVLAGELDGVTEGEKFLVRRQDPTDPGVWHEVALLEIKHPEPVYSGSTIRPLTSQVEGVRVWDMAERQLPGVRQWRTAGIVEQVDAASRTAIGAVEPACPVKAGEVIAWTPDREAPPGAAIVLHRDTDRVLLYIPPGWGDLDLLARARIAISK